MHHEYTSVSWITTKTFQFYIDPSITRRRTQVAVTSFRFTFENSENIANIKIEEKLTGKTYSLYETENCQLVFTDVQGKLELKLAKLRKASKTINVKLPNAIWHTASTLARNRLQFKIF